MRQAAEQRQVFLTSRSRPLTPQDLSSFDYLIGMDAKNVADIQVGSRQGSRTESDFAVALAVISSAVAICVGTSWDCSEAGAGLRCADVQWFASVNRAGGSGSLGSKT
jgi:protein-tyrosine-phosphatase